MHPYSSPTDSTPSTQQILSLYPEMSSYEAAPSAGDTAAHAFSSLSLNKDRDQRYDATLGPGEGPPSSYPPSVHPSYPYSSQGLPYLASPISGVVTGVSYAPPAPSSYPSWYDKPDNSPAPLDRSSSAPEPSSYPPSAPYESSYPASTLNALNLPENLDVSSTGKEKTKQSSYPPQYGRPPSPNAVSYQPESSTYPPKLNESNRGQSYPSFSPYGATPPAPAVPYPQPEGHDDQGQQKTKNDFDSPTSSYGSSPFPRSNLPQSGYPPQGSYLPESGQHDHGALPQHTVEHSSPTTGYPSQTINSGDFTSESTVSSSSEGGADGEKGFKHGQQHGYGGYPQHGYVQPEYPQHGYGQPTYPQPGYEAYPSHGYAPSYPPAYPGHGYTPEAYPSYGYGVPEYVQPYEYGGHGVPHHAPAPYGVHGAPHYGGHGDYKHHKGGHAEYKHKKMKKGHYLHYQEPYGHHGGHQEGHYGGHQGGHHGGHYGGKHGHGKHKH